MSRVSKKDRQKAIDRLKDLLKPGDTVHTLVRHVSQSGMMRIIDVYKFACDDKGRVTRYWLSYSVAKVLEWPFNKKRAGIRVDGCGMDMGFHLVYTLGRVLFQKDLDEGKITTAQTRNGEPETDAGYLLRQEWI